MTTICNRQCLADGFGKIVLLGSVAAMALGISGCAGLSNSDEGFFGECTTCPTLPPDDDEASDVAQVGEVIAPGLGTDPIDPTTFEDLLAGADGDTDQTMKLRLVQSARSLSLGEVSQTFADQATDDGGGHFTVTIPADPDAETVTTFTLGNDALGIKDVAFNEDDYESSVREVTLSDGRKLSVALFTEDRNTGGAGEDLDWTAYGTWGIRNATNVPQKGAVFVTGIETSDSHVPTSGSATFNGFVEGSVTVPNGSAIDTASIRGDATITANFANGTITGAAPEIIAIPISTLPITGPVTPGDPQPWNGLSFQGTMTSGLNGFSGTTVVTTAPTGAYSLLDSAAGYFAGMFYGPGAEELGAVWNLYDGVGAATGVLVGKQ
ncbi:transferrin-binding protein-like solute binding protein [Novosphingobium sp. KN65.2]|uniref:transferrin-binding protein-like solute binding protein n=1 Tax=Novosphingobium sp. KN65.2 TaxID=1478134 RepID=UPI0005DECF7C|nr:transferrin-binding protein-like solute binding protein [Novosphingobium sp. KN65.2]CDO35454.1 hypothetical protein SPHV1_2250055 [Novosphingobium sp. KN65.2]